MTFSSRLFLSRLFIGVAVLCIIVSCTMSGKVPPMRETLSFFRQKIFQDYEIGNDDLLSIRAGSKDTILAHPFNRAAGDHRQNDLIYVELNKAQPAQNGYNPGTTLILTAISVLSSLASLIILIKADGSHAGSSRV